MGTSDGIPGTISVFFFFWPLVIAIMYVCYLGQYGNILC